MARKPLVLPGLGQLLSGSFKTLKDNPRLVWLVAVVLIPSTLLSFGSAETSALGSLAAILMNLALIWAVIEVGNKRKFTVKEAYFKGTEAFIQFMLTALMLVIMMLPLVVALSIAGIGIIPAQAAPAERILLAGLALVLAAPTVYWLTRYVFALFIICESRDGPITALRQSGRLVKGRWYEVFKRLIVIALIAALIGSVPVLAIALTQAAISEFALMGIQVTAGMLGLPYINLYLNQLYRTLNGQKASG